MHPFDLICSQVIHKKHCMPSKTPGTKENEEYMKKNIQSTFISQKLTGRAPKVLKSLTAVTVGELGGQACSAGAQHRQNRREMLRHVQNAGKCQSISSLSSDFNV